MGGNGTSESADRDAPGTPSAQDRRAAVPVHVANEEWTRRVLWLLGSDEFVGATTLPSPVPAQRAIVWELLPGRIVAGCEHSQEMASGTDASDGAHRAGTRPAGVGRAGRRTVLLEGHSWPPEPAVGVPFDAGLVTVDVEPGRRVLVDLVAARVTTLTGDARDRDAFARRMAIELAERRWSQLEDLVLVGMASLTGPLAGPGEALHVDDLVELEELLATPGGASSGPRRRSGRDDRRAGTPRATLVVIGPRCTDDVARLDQLVALATELEGMGGGDDELAMTGRRRPVATRSRTMSVVIAASWPGARCTMAVSPGGARADVFLSPQLTGAGSHAPGAPYAERPTRFEEAPPSAVSLVRTAKAPPEASSVPSPADVNADTCVEVGVLGRVDIRGVEGSFTRRPKLKELVVFLALHPGGAPTSTWATALWPGRRVPGQTVANRLSEARRLLGFASDGRPRLRRNGELHLLADVTTDWDRFQDLAAPDRGAASWRAALALVRGRPFEDLPSGLWTAFECIAVEIERAVTECALRCGDQLLAAGDAEGAAWAAHQGLKLCPWDERLHRLLMLTADATGNRAGVEATMRHLALVLEVDGDPLPHVHPETAALYQRLAGRAPGSPH